MRKGTSHSAEAREKIRNAKLGKTFLPEHVQKISDALKGRKKSEDHRKAIGLGVKLAHEKKVNSQTELSTGEVA